MVEDKAPNAERFAAYAVVQEHDDPYAKAIQQLVEHSQELERTIAALQREARPAGEGRAGAACA